MTLDSISFKSECCPTGLHHFFSDPLTHFYFLFQKHFVVFCCILVTIVAAPPKRQKISLEDIEKDNLRKQKIPPPPEVKEIGPTNYGFLPIKTSSDYARQEPRAPQYIPAPVTPQVYYQPQPSYENNNIQYVSENEVQPQYYTQQPQYVYFQPYTAPTTAVQTVVDLKGGVQYIMYVPAYTSQKEEPSHNFDHVVPENNQEQPLYQEEEVQPTPSIKYAPEPPAQAPKNDYKSLLDSYVPSYLQVQYYKQQQARANSIHHSYKSTLH